MPSFTTNMTRRELGEEVEIEIEVEYAYFGGSRGSRDSFGVPTEPDEPASCELILVHDLTTPLHDIGLGDTDQEWLEQLALEHANNGYEPDYDPPEPDPPEPAPVNPFVPVKGRWL